MCLCLTTTTTGFIIPVYLCTTYTAKNIQIDPRLQPVVYDGPKSPGELQVGR